MELLGVISCARAVLFWGRGRGETMSNATDKMRVLGVVGKRTYYTKVVTREEHDLFFDDVRDDQVRGLVRRAGLNYKWRDGTRLCVLPGSDVTFWSDEVAQ